MVRHRIVPLQLFIFLLRQLYLLMPAALSLLALFPRHDLCGRCFGHARVQRQESRIGRSVRNGSAAAEQN